jgi:predicted amidohydrolase YtcJ
LERNAGGHADYILCGRVVTLDGKSSIAEALAVAGGKILAVGDRDSVLKRRQAGTVVHDFGDAAIIPGFNDTHAHMDAPGMQTIWPSLSGARSVSDVLQRIRELAARTPAGEWIVTMPVGEPPLYFDGPSQLAEKRMPTRHELDSAAPDHPVYIASPSGYWGEPPSYSALNSLGLKLNGIDRRSKPTAGGVEILRDASGEPNGVLVEHNVSNLAEMDLLPAIPRFGYGDRLGSVRRSMKLYHAQGTTSIYEGHGSAPDVLASYRELHEYGELSMRVSMVVSPTWRSVDEAARAMRDWLPLARGRGVGDAMLRLSGVFLNYGGNAVVPSLAQKHPGDSGWFGMMPQFNTPADFEALCLLAAQAELRVHTVISDRLHEMLPVMERIAQSYPIGQRRWVFEHISKSTPEDLRRLHKLGVGVTLIPAHYLWKTGHKFFGLSEAEQDYLSPARQLAELGVPVSAGTDAFPCNPLFSMWVMTTRQERTTGRIMGPGGRSSNETALRLLTEGGAWLSFDEDVKGRLAPGYFADIAVLDRDPLTAQGDGLLDIRCLATMVNGKWVHGGLA